MLTYNHHPILSDTTCTNNHLQIIPSRSVYKWMLEQITPLPMQKNYYQLYKSITQVYNIYGVEKEAVVVQCTGKGFLPWQSKNGDLLCIPCYYSEQAADSIISPTNVVLSHIQLYSEWAQFAHVNTGWGHITFYRIYGTNHTSYPLRMDYGFMIIYSPHQKILLPPPLWNMP